jgi:hypothetical protein
MNVAVRRLVAPLVVAAGVLGTFGCASPPAAQKKAAEEAVSAAKTAGAEQYASRDFAVMTNALKEAEAWMIAKKYREAGVSYVKVKELADKATKAVEAGKIAMKVEVDNLMADTTKRWQVLEDKVKKIAKTLKAEQKQAWAAEAKSVTEAFEAAKAAPGDDPAAAKDKLASVAAILDRWEGELKAVAEAGKEAKQVGSTSKPGVR